MTKPNNHRIALQESECPECCGNGQTIGPNSGEDIICPHCRGTGRPGWQDYHDQEKNDG